MKTTHITTSYVEPSRGIKHGTFRDKSKGLTLQFIGLRQPVDPHNQHNIAYPLGKGSNHSNVISLQVETGLTRNSTVSDLKVCIKETYSIPSGNDLFIQYAHTVISMNDGARLQDFGVTDQSVLIVAIVIDKRPKIKVQSACSHQYISRSLSSAQKTMQGPVLGLDIITQETGVPLFRMPVCGHLMS